MIFGLLAIFAIIVMRFSAPSDPPLPEVITLPSGKTATAFTQGTDWYAVVTDGDEILIFDRSSGELRQTVKIQTSN